MDFHSVIYPIKVNTQVGKYIDRDINPEAKFANIFHPDPVTDWFFTDGSKSSKAEYAGFAAISISSGTVIQGRTSSYTTVFSCEAIAIISALDLAM